MTISNLRFPGTCTDLTVSLGSSGSRGGGGGGGAEEKTILGNRENKKNKFWQWGNKGISQYILWEQGNKRAFISGVQRNKGPNFEGKKDTRTILMNRENKKTHFRQWGNRRKDSIR